MNVGAFPGSSLGNSRVTASALGGRTYSVPNGRWRREYRDVANACWQGAPFSYNFVGLSAEVTLAESDRADRTKYGLVRRSVFRLAGISLGALAARLGHAHAREIAGSVEELRGDAFAQAEQERRKLENTGLIFLDDEISTGSASRLAMHLGKDTVVRLGELAHLKIDRSVENVGGELTLVSGPLLFDRAPGAKPRPLRIRSPFGLIAVRGTRFFAGPSAGVFGVFVQRGSVSVSAAGTEVVLHEGEGTNISQPGEAPTPPSIWRQPRIDAALESTM